MSILNHQNHLYKNKKWIVIVIMIYLGCMSIYHILPAKTTKILFWVSEHGLKIYLLLVLWKILKMRSLMIASIYVGIKLIYHLALMNLSYAEYLESLHSELISGILSFSLLIYFIYEYEILQKDSENNT